MKALSCIFLLLALVMTAAAADVSGKWSGTFTVLGSGGQPDSPSSAYMVVKQTGTAITGTGGPSESEQWPIQSGKITGNKITAQVTSPEGAVYTLAMTLTGDKLAGEAAVLQGGQTMKAKIEMQRMK